MGDLSSNCGCGCESNGGCGRSMDCGCGCGFGNNSCIWIIPVSYTHLDVYKRQLVTLAIMLAAAIDTL